MEWLLREAPALTPTECLKRVTELIVCSWIADAWAWIPAALDARNFKKCGIWKWGRCIAGHWLWRRNVVRRHVRWILGWIKVNGFHSCYIRAFGFSVGLPNKITPCITIRSVLHCGFYGTIGTTRAPTGGLICLQQRKHAKMVLSFVCSSSCELEKVVFLEACSKDVEASDKCCFYLFIYFSGRKCAQKVFHENGS